MIVGLPHSQASSAIVCSSKRRSATNSGCDTRERHMGQNEASADNLGFHGRPHAGVKRLPLVRRGDAFDFLNDLDDNSVNLVIISSCYWGLRTYGLEHGDGVL